MVVTPNEKLTLTHEVICPETVSLTLTEPPSLPQGAATAPT